MSQCPQCWVGQCRRHPLQDNGKREKDLKARVINPQETLKKMYDVMVAKQLDKLEEAAKGTNAKDNQEYRDRQERERLKAQKRGNKFTKEQQTKAAQMRLGGHLVKIMLSSEDESEDEGAKKDGKKRKRDKDKDKEKKSKKRRKEKDRDRKEKKRKKSKKKERARRSSSPSSSSDGPSAQDSDDSDSSEEDRSASDERRRERKQRKEAKRRKREAKRDKRDKARESSPGQGVAAADGDDEDGEVKEDHSEVPAGSPASNEVSGPNT